MHSAACKGDRLFIASNHHVEFVAGTCVCACVRVCVRAWHVCQLSVSVAVYAYVSVYASALKKIGIVCTLCHAMQMPLGVTHVRIIRTLYPQPQCCGGVHLSCPR